MGKALNHFLDLNEIPTRELRNILAASVAMKAKLKAKKKPDARPLEGKTLAMIFEKPSTRTRVSFDVGMSRSTFCGPTPSARWSASWSKPRMTETENFQPPG